MENRSFRILKGWEMGFMLISGICITVFSGCASDKKPDHILSHEKMVSTLIEVYIAEEKVNRLGLPYDSAQKFFENMQPSIFNKSGVVDSVFIQSLGYYTNSPEDMHKIYTAVVDSLQLREQRASRPQGQ